MSEVYQMATGSWLAVDRQFSNESAAKEYAAARRGEDEKAAVAACGKKIAAAIEEIEFCVRRLKSGLRNPQFVNELHTFEAAQALRKELEIAVQDFRALENAPNFAKACELAFSA